MLAASTFACAAAYAHGEGAEQTAPAIVEITGSAANRDARRDDTAGKIVINREEIVRYGDTNVLDTLKRLPGVTVNGGVAQLRGLGAGYTQILLNGERAPAGFSLDSLSPESIERIEIARAATADSSTNAIAGTINIILKRATPQGQREWKAGLGHSSGMAEGKASLNMSDRDGKFSYSLSANASRNTFRRPVTTTESGRDRTGASLFMHALRGGDFGSFNAFNLGPRLNWQLDNGDMLSWQSFIYANRLHYGSPYVTDYLSGAHVIDPLNDSTTYSTRLNGRTDLNWTHKLGNSAKLDARIGLDAANYATELGQRSTRAAGAASQDRFVDGLSRDRAIRSTGKYTGQSDGGHAFGLGWEASVGHNTSDRNQFDFSAPATPERYHADLSRLALYAQDEWAINSQWSIYLGGRWEGIHTTIGGSSLADIANRSNVFSPIMHGLYKFPGNSGSQLRLALTRTYKAPDATQLVPRRVTTINNSASNPDTIGNPGLRPELATGLDAAYEYYWAKGALLSMSVAVRHIDNVTVQQLSESAGRWLIRPENAGRADVRNIELESRFPLQTVWAQGPAMDVRLSLSRNWSAVRAVPGPDNRLAEQIPLSGTAGVDYKFSTWTMGGTYTFNSARRVQVSSTQSSYASVRRDMELYGLWKVNQTSQLRLSVWNFLHQDWVTDRTYTSAQGTRNTHSVQPGKVWVRAMWEARF